MGPTETELEVARLVEAANLYLAAAEHQTAETPMLLERFRHLTAMFLAKQELP